MSSSGFSLTLLLGLLGVLLLLVICGVLMLIKLKNHSRFIVHHVNSNLICNEQRRSVIIHNVNLYAGCTAGPGEAVVHKERGVAVEVSENV